MTSFFSDSEDTNSFSSALSHESIPRFCLTTDNQAASDYYSQNGFVVISSFVDSSISSQFCSAWKSEVKSSNRSIPRYPTGHSETNIFSLTGAVSNPVFNVHSLNRRDFPRLRFLFDQHISDNFELSSFLSLLLKDKPKLFQSIFFESPSSSSCVQDSFLFDDEDLGSMCSGIISLDDNFSTVPRFFVVPRSHLVDSFTSNNSLASSSDILKNYNALSLTYPSQINPVFPLLRIGDLLLWNSLTIHGSLKPSRPHCSHYLSFNTIKTSSRLSVSRTSIHDCIPFSNRAFDISSYSHHRSFSLIDSLVSFVSNFSPFSS